MDRIDRQRLPRLARALCLHASLLWAAALPAWPQSSPSPAVPTIPFADAHVHLNDLAMQLALMDRWGATHAVVFWGGRSSNESVSEAAKRHPDRLIPFASISPERSIYRPGWSADDPALLAQLDALLATGLYRGIGEISASHFPASGFANGSRDTLLG